MMKNNPTSLIVDDPYTRRRQQMLRTTTTRTSSSRVSSNDQANLHHRHYHNYNNDGNYRYLNESTTKNLINLSQPAQITIIARKDINKLWLLDVEKLFDDDQNDTSTTSSSSSSNYNHEDDQFSYYYDEIINHKNNYSATAKPPICTNYSNNNNNNLSSSTISTNNNTSSSDTHRTFNLIANDHRVTYSPSTSPTSSINNEVSIVLVVSDDSQPTSDQLTTEPSSRKSSKRKKKSSNATSSETVSSSSSQSSKNSSGEANMARTNSQKEFTESLSRLVQARDHVQRFNYFKTICSAKKDSVYDSTMAKKLIAGSEANHGRVDHQVTSCNNQKANLPDLGLNFYMPAHNVESVAKTLSGSTTGADSKKRSRESRIQPEPQRVVEFQTNKKKLGKSVTPAHQSDQASIVESRKKSEKKRDSEKHHHETQSNPAYFQPPSHLAASINPNIDSGLRRDSSSRRHSSSSTQKVAHRSNRSHSTSNHTDGSTPHKHHHHHHHHKNKTTSISNQYFQVSYNLYGLVRSLPVFTKPQLPPNHKSRCRYWVSSPPSHESLTRAVDSLSSSSMVVRKYKPSQVKKRNRIKKKKLSVTGHLTSMRSTTISASSSSLENLVTSNSGLIKQVVLKRKKSKIKAIEKSDSKKSSPIPRDQIFESKRTLSAETCSAKSDKPLVKSGVTISLSKTNTNIIKSITPSQNTEPTPTIRAPILQTLNSDDSTSTSGNELDESMVKVENISFPAFTQNLSRQNRVVFREHSSNSLNPSSTNQNQSTENQVSQEEKYEANLPKLLPIVELETSNLKCIQTGTFSVVGKNWTENNLNENHDENRWSQGIVNIKQSSHAQQINLMNQPRIGKYARPNMMFNQNRNELKNLSVIAEEDLMLLTNNSSSTRNSMIINNQKTDTPPPARNKSNTITETKKQDEEDPTLAISNLSSLSETVSSSSINMTESVTVDERKESNLNGSDLDDGIIYI